MKYIDLLEFLRFCRANEFILFSDGSQMGTIKRCDSSIVFEPENLIQFKDYITEIDIIDNKVCVYYDTSF